MRALAPALVIVGSFGVLSFGAGFLFGAGLSLAGLLP